MKEGIGQQNEIWAIEAAKQGLADGLGFLYEKHKNYVFSLCLRMTRQPALAEDLMQDIFLHLGRKIHLFKGAAAFRSWLHRITVNKVAMYFRRHKHADVSLDNDTTSLVAFEVPDHASGIDLDTRITLGEALACLAPQRRRILLLHDLEGYQHKDISQLLGISPGASRCQLYHARLKIRARLGVRPTAKRRRRSRLMLQSSHQPAQVSCCSS